jgi:hypothetical protein
MSASNTGQIAFIADRVSTTAEEYFRDDTPNKALYILPPQGGEQVEIPVIAGYLFSNAWSPNGRYLVYEEGFSLYLLDTVTMEYHKFPDIDPFIGFDISWAFNNQKFAATVHEEIDGAFDNELHLYIFNIDGTAQPVMIQQ